MNDLFPRHVAEMLAETERHLTELGSYSRFIATILAYVREKEQKYRAPKEKLIRRSANSLGWHVRVGAGCWVLSPKDRRAYVLQAKTLSDILRTIQQDRKQREQRLASMPTRPRVADIAADVYRLN